MQTKFYALLFDTLSIQRYIYSGNRLSTNIGASYIVDQLFNEILINDVLQKIFPAVNVPYTGLTLSCEINGEAANFCKVSNGEVRFYSQETAIKAEVADAANLV